MFLVNLPKGLNYDTINVDIKREINMENINQINLQKNQQFVVKIIDYGANGEGIAKINGLTVFVPFALVGETVEILIVQVKKDFAFAKVLNVVEKSNKRVDAPCPYFTKCGGCQLQHMDYSEQLQYKTYFVRNCLKKYANISADVNACKPCVNEYKYRNKFSFPVQEVDGKICVGMYRVGSHKFVKIDDCLLQTNAKNIIDAFIDYATKYNIKVYNDQTKNGVKHLVCRFFDDEILLTIVATKKMQNLQYLYDNLCKNYKIVNISVNINKKENNVIMGDVDYTKFGSGYLQIQEYGLKYFINNHSFMQVNNYIKHQLYNEVLNYVNTNDTVIDAYSGAGVLSAILAQKCKRVYGIEIVKPAVESANMLAKNNRIKNCTNICGDCAVELPKLVDKLSDFIVVLDPPRKGCDVKVLQALNKTLPNKIIYISCNPATLARDLNILNDNYNVQSITPYDMFPQTANVETLAILTKK